MADDRRPYPSKLTDAEWTVHEPLLPVAVGRGRPPKWPRRQVSKDYERLPATSETMIYTAMSRTMLRRLAR